MSIFREGILTGQGLIGIMFFAICVFCWKVSIRQKLEMYKIYSILALSIGFIFFLVFMFQVSGILIDIPPRPM